FVQAEDGIRDRNVTGVQTCALPISALCGIQHGLSSTPLLADPEGRRRYASGAAREDRAAHRVRGDGAPEDVVRVRFPSGLSPSVQEFHLVGRGPEAIGPRTVTAGAEF